MAAIRAKGSTTKASKRKHKGTAKEKALPMLGESNTDAQSSKQPRVDNADDGDDNLSQPLPKDADLERKVQ